MAKKTDPRWRILAPSDIDQLKKRARELLKAYATGDAETAVLFADFDHAVPKPVDAKLADAQMVLARAHDFPSWPRMRRAVALFNAMCADDPEIVISLIKAHPDLLHERVNGVTSNWGPPLACAVQIGSERVFEALLSMPGQDIQWAMDRAILKGRTQMARALMAVGAKPEPGAAMGPCESLCVDGLRFLTAIGAPLTNECGDSMAPIGMLLEGYARDATAKHVCLEFFAGQGIEYPDTPVMAFHRGRIDLLERHLSRDPSLLRQCFSYRDIYPLELGCHKDESLGLHGTPLDGTTLLHMAIDFDETAIAHWLLDKGADVNAKALLTTNGFGGHTPIFQTVVSQAHRCGQQSNGTTAAFLLDHGADPNIEASIRKGIRFIADESVHEYRDVTPLAYGRAFHAQAWVNKRAMEIITQHGGS